MLRVRTPKGIRMKIAIVASFLTLSICFAQTDSLHSNSKESNAGIVYGTNHAFIITAPEGWILDNSSGVNQGLHAVLYPKGGSWNYSPTVMYANTASKNVKGNETLEKLMSFDSLQFKARDKDIKIEDATPLFTNTNKEVKIRYFIDKSAPSYEATAYIDEEKIVTLLVLSSRDETGFKDSKSKFEELIKSYILISDTTIFK